jgi:hypothetical protein
VWSVLAQVSRDNIRNEELLLSQIEGVDGEPEGMWYTEIY